MAPWQAYNSRARPIELDETLMKDLTLALVQMEVSQLLRFRDRS